ncbi:MAG TPA: phage holin family protein [Casimicrobiaceae bacterium]|nr:phage holin family protein [Casimicrobiaceae bacterium]
MSISAAPRAFRLVQHARSLVANARGVGRDLLELVKLEARVAAASALSVVIFSVLALILVITGWILLIAALVTWLADNWLGLPGALLIVGAVMLAGMIPCIVMLRMRARDLTFPATRRQLEDLSHGE